MKDSQKTKKQLIEELQEARKKIAEQAASGEESSSYKATTGELEDVYGNIFDLFPIGVTIVDMKGVVLYCNSAVYEKSGHPEKEFEGKHFSKLATLRVQDIPKFIRVFNSLVRGKIPKPFEVIYQRKDGTTGWTEVSIGLLKMAGKRRIIVIQHDITERKQAEESMRESEEKYRTLVEDTIIGIMNLDLTGKITYINETILQTTGYSREELVGKNALTLGLIPGEATNILRTRMKEKLMGQPPGRLETKFKCKDGKWIWLEIRGGLLRIHNIPVGFQITGEEITERKWAEEALKESEEKFRIASKLASDVVYERDLQTGIATFYGDIDTHLGYEQGGYPRTMEGWRERVHPEDLARIDGQSLDHLEQGVPYEIEYRMRKKDGTYMTWLDRIMVVKDKETGKSAKIIGAASDITERKRAEEALRESEEKFLTAFRSSPDMIIITDIENGKYLEVNDSFIDITGYSREELIGHTIEEFKMFVKPEDQEEMTRLMQEKGEIRNEEYSFRTKSGEIRQWLCSAEIIKIGGKQCMIAAASDITEVKRVEEFIRTQAEVTKNMAEGAYIVGLNDAIIRWTSHRFESMFGYEPGEMIGQHVSIVNAPTDLTPIERADEIMEVIRRTGEWRGEVHNIKKDGTPFWCYASVSTFTHPEYGEALVAVHTDITERKQAEEALAEEAIRRRILIDESLDGIVVLDEDARVIEANRRFAEMLGYTPEEVSKLHTWDWDTEFAREELLEMGRSISPEGLHLETRHRRKDGTFFDVDISISGATVAGQKLIFCVCRDVTARKLAEMAMRESEEKFSKWFRSSPEIIAINRVSDGKFLEVNDRYTRVTGYSREELIGHSSLEMGIWAKPNERERMLKVLKDKGRVTNEEYSLRTKSGDLRVMLFSAEQITLGNEPCLLSVTIDITDYRKMEAKARETEYLRELDKLRTELLANISHELRTPLASIKGFATMLLDYGDRLKTREKKDYLETIDKNTDRLVELIEQLLEMSRLEAGMLSINKRPASISRLCREALAEARVRSSTHRFTLDIPAKLPRVNVDSRRVRQVLDNIIDNSIKYSDADTEVNLRIRRKGPELIFTITDHGTGIPQQDLPRVFNRMFHSPKKPGVTGVGLGLSICKGLVEAHGGKIWIESEEGKGTSCFFTLPLDTGNGEQD
jgi:PAS domain S-box-containing protein